MNPSLFGCMRCKGILDAFAEPPERLCVTANKSHLILCVDDEVVGLRVRKILLERAGYEVLTAEDGNSGIELFATQPVDAVVLDYAMPGMHGGEVAKRMRQTK